MLQWLLLWSQGIFSTVYSFALFFFSVYFPGGQQLKIIIVTILQKEAISRMHAAVLFWPHNLGCRLYFKKGSRRRGLLALFF